MGALLKSYACIQEEEQPFVHEIHHEKAVNSTTHDICSPKNVTDAHSEVLLEQDTPLVLATTGEIHTSELNGL